MCKGGKRAVRATKSKMGSNNKGNQLGAGTASGTLDLDLRFFSPSEQCALLPRSAEQQSLSGLLSISKVQDTVWYMCIRVQRDSK